MSWFYDVFLGKGRFGRSSTDKGVFPTSAALIARWPTGKSGWHAFVENTNTDWVWDMDTSAWVNSGAHATPAWGSITGTLSSQSDLNSALSGKEAANANIQSHISETGTPHVTAGEKSGWDSKEPGNANIQSHISETGTPHVTSGEKDTWNAKLSDALSDGNQYARKNGAWDVVAAGTAWGGITGTLANQADLKESLDGKQVMSGFPNRTDSAIAMDGANFKITSVGASYDVWVNGIRHTISTDKTVPIANDRELHYVYFDAAGDLQVSLSAWDIASPLASPCAIVFRDGTDYAITDERHSSARNRPWHNWAHNNIGAMFRSGLGAQFGSPGALIDGLHQIKVEQGIIADEDICFDTGGIKTSTTLWHRGAGGAGMRMIRNQPGAYATVEISPGVLGLAYDNNGTLASVGGNAYATNWVYGSNDAFEPIYTVAGQATYPSLNQARNAPRPTINLSTAEWKLLYRVIYRRTTPGGVETIGFIEATDFRDVQTGVPTSAMSPADHAALINRDAANSHPASAVSYDPATSGLTATDVQAAIDEVAARNTWADATTDLGTISGTANCTIDAATAAEATVTFAASAVVTLVASNFTAARSSVHVVLTNGGAATSINYGTIQVANKVAPSWTVAGKDEFLIYRTGDGAINIAVGRQNIGAIP
jgi:hypothetical protein